MSRKRILLMTLPSEINLLPPLQKWSELINADYDNLPNNVCVKRITVSIAVIGTQLSMAVYVLKVKHYKKCYVDYQLSVDSYLCQQEIKICGS